MAGSQMSSEEVMKFMSGFKDSIEKTMNNIGKDINKKIEEKLSKLDKGMEDLTSEVRSNDKKQEVSNRKLEARLKRLEIDAERARYGRTKKNSDRLDGKMSGTSRTDGRTAESKEERGPGNEREGEIILKDCVTQRAGKFVLQDELTTKEKESKEREGN